MSMQTQKQGITGKKSFGQTVAQSFRVMGGVTVPSYSLYFMNPTKRNRAGENETIVIPYVEIGRGSGCAVQYGDEYPNVSRKHAAIRYDNGKIILKHLSSTNPTIITGSDGNTQQLSTVGQEAEVQNGSQIQFAYDGPTLRLNTSNPNATSKMGVTQRVQLALRQGIRPYRNAVAALAFAIVALGATSSYFLKGAYDQNDELMSEVDDLRDEAEMKEKTYKKLLADGKKETDAEVKKAKAEARRAQKKAEKAQYDANQARLAIQAEKENTPSIVSTTSNTVSPPGNPNDFGTKGALLNMQQAKSSVYFIYPKDVRVRHPELNNNKEFSLDDLHLVIGKPEPVQWRWTGTAFNTTEKKLVTARHVVAPWRFPSDCNDVYALVSECEMRGNVRAIYSLIAPGGKELVEFTSSQINYSDTEDKPIDVRCKNGVTQITMCPDEGMFTDWAWVNMSFSGDIPLSRDLSSNLSYGDELEIFGYSKGMALQDIKRRGFDPLYGLCTVAQDGLPNKIIRVGDRPFTGGASGGPVFAKKDGYYYAVGIISHGIDNIGGIVPVLHLQ